MADPIFACELALELSMPVGELGERMSNYELNVLWPQFFAYRAREAARQRREAEASRRRR